MKLVWTSFFAAFLFAAGIATAQEQFVTYDDIDAAPVIGKVAAVNPHYGFMVFKASDLQPAVRQQTKTRTIFHRVVVRRNGVLRASGFIEEIEGNMVTVGLTDLRRDGSNRPIVGDQVIVLAPPKSK